MYVPFCWLGVLGLRYAIHETLHSREFLLRNPERRNDDFNAINKACTKFKLAPTTLVNFVEGTRANHEKLASAKNTPPPSVGRKQVVWRLPYLQWAQFLDGIVDVTLKTP
ncbi:hypothetical protein OH492_11570 [Vibrio chagasii]|nr:hypothetical protein [Vibrio chagasii]